VDLEPPQQPAPRWCSAATAARPGGLVQPGWWRAGEDGTVRFWDASPVDDPVVFDGHRGAAWVPAVSRDGRLLASAGEDGTIRVRAASGGGEPARPLEGTYSCQPPPIGPAAWTFRTFCAGADATAT
jgi:WD40 repeat protein